MPTPEGQFILDLTARPDVEDAYEDILDFLEPILASSGLPLTAEAGESLGALLGPSLAPTLFDALLEKYGKRTLVDTMHAFLYMRRHDDHDAVMQKDGSIVRAETLVGA